MLLVDGRGLPLAIEIHPATPAEVTLIENRCSLKPNSDTDRNISFTTAPPTALRARLAARGIELVCPHRQSRKKAATQDGRALRRYAKRWIVERTIAWPQVFRRLVRRYEFFPQLS